LRQKVKEDPVRGPVFKQKKLDYSRWYNAEASTKVSYQKYRDGAGYKLQIVTDAIR
jgi:hypothetical protein